MLVRLFSRAHLAASKRWATGPPPSDNSRHDSNQGRMNSQQQRIEDRRQQQRTQAGASPQRAFKGARDPAYNRFDTRHESLRQANSPREPPTNPTVEFVGWGEWNRDGRLSHEVQDQAMHSACEQAFGRDVRAATWSEYFNNEIKNLPPVNESDLWLHFTGKEGWGLDNGKGYQWKKCVWRKKLLDGGFTEDSCSASICSAAAVKPLRR